MATSLRSVIENFKINMDEIDAHLQAHGGYEYINEVARKAKQVSSALKLLKLAVRTSTEKIDGPYYTDPENAEAFSKDDDVFAYYNNVAAEGMYSIIILDDESPLFLQEVPLMISHEYDENNDTMPTRLISFLVDGKECNFINDRLGEYKEKAFPPIDDTIKQFIEDTKKKAKDIEELRKITSIENHPIGEEKK